MSEREDGSRPRRPSGYTLLVGVAFVALVIFAAVNALRTTDSGTIGIGEYGIGEPAPRFAVPLVTSDLDGDANVDPDRACEVPGRDAIRVCDLFDRPLVISFWFTRRAESCIAQQDVFEAVARRFRDRAGFLSINVRDDRDRVRELVAEHGWKVPVGHDRDGAVSNLYRVGGCPTFVFVSPGGTIGRAEIGETDARRLGAQVRSFLDGETEAEETPHPPGG